MLVSELLAQFRAQTNDIGVPSLCSDQEFILYLNEAEREACARARLIIDSTTEEICKVQLTAGVQTYPLDDRIIFINRLRTNNHNQPITRIKMEILDNEDPLWETRTGRVEKYVIGYQSRSLVFYKTPTVDQEIRMTVVREPLEKMKSLSDSPEILERYHLPLLYWCYFRFYSKLDTEQNNEEYAKKYLGLFDQEFGSKAAASAREEEWQLRIEGMYNDGAY